MVSDVERARSFGAIADDYDRARPGPPEVAVDWLVPEHARAVVDLGAGTGLLSRVLTSKVPQVIAVEPDPRMRAVLAARSPGVRVLEGTGEAIPLPDASVDGVFVSSAWHWMDPDRAIPEIARVLRGGGRFGVIWTHRDHQAGWLRDLGRDRVETNTDPNSLTRPRRHDIKLPDGGRFEHIDTAVFEFTHTTTVAGFLAWHATYSNMITASPEEREAELARLRAALAERFPSAGQLDVPMRSRCWRADRVARS
jgi:SAM-dependent methyltransferase